MWYLGPCQLPAGGHTATHWLADSCRDTTGQQHKEENHKQGDKDKCCIRKYGIAIDSSRLCTAAGMPRNVRQVGQGGLGNVLDWRFMWRFLMENFSQCQVPVLSTSKKILDMMGRVDPFGRNIRNLGSFAIWRRNMTVIGVSAC